MNYYYDLKNVEKYVQITEGNDSFYVVLKVKAL